MVSDFVSWLVTKTDRLPGCVFQCHPSCDLLHIYLLFLSSFSHSSIHLLSFSFAFSVHIIVSSPSFLSLHPFHCETPCLFAAGASFHSALDAYFCDLLRFALVPNVCRYIRYLDFRLFFCLISSYGSPALGDRDIIASDIASCAYNHH